ncbi:hypothetical protein [Adhaeribacter pallidiroseus]|uniref:Uncharacterized protein n=1 Tax=Adhaeribacter pallidiroseus TaxID=2072847 RepID=A0A369QIT7_9BACT|nr:hypothetical protein [Adhaeribacter pallidiroseus]RDC64821.1 hypothetical protein AHMF7616_03441 [Adhaeribacter pallidiroseus]
MNEAIKSNSFGPKNKVLRINNKVIQFNRQTIARKDIVGIKQYARAMQFYRFRVGEQHYLGLKTATAQIDILFTCYFSIDQDYFIDLENRIIAEIWEQTTDQIWLAGKTTLLNHGTLTVGPCQISRQGILVTKGNALPIKQQQIAWADLQYQVLHDRLVLNNQNDYAVYTNLYFKNTWNIDVLIALLDWITQENGLGNLPAT